MKKPKLIKKYILIILIIACLALVAVAFYFYHKATLLKQSAASQQKQVASLVLEVGRIMLLPTDETPTVATVSDPALLKNQSFFVDAKKGDKVLIYTNAKRAILYDPVQKKIINVASIDIGANQSSLPSTTSPGTTQTP